MVNLLPQNVRRSLIRNYYLRLVALALFAAAVSIFFGGLLLVPSFFLARSTAEQAARYRSALEETVGLKERAGVAHDVSVFAERVRVLDALAAAPIVTDAVGKITDAMPKGATLTAVSIVRTDTGATLGITGSAATRDTLLSLAAALKDVGGFSGIALPVSSLASDKDIPFSISITYTVHAP
jgi:Tfp pilus assembly protein PilN